MAHTVAVVVPEDADHERAGETVTVRVREGEHVHEAAGRQGLELPANCEQGWCTRCAARLLDGELDQSDAMRYYDVDREAGLVLACTARPRSDLRVRSHQYRAMRVHRGEHGLPPGAPERG